MTVTTCGQSPILLKQACRNIAPSVHLCWHPVGTALLPLMMRTAWFYNEVVVKESFPATYFMVCGWGNGYLGIQYKGAQGCKVLFSVWDHASKGTPSESIQNPDEVANEVQTKMLSQGVGVTARRFGNEGMGGQSVFYYTWRIGQTCRCLVHCTPDPNYLLRCTFSGYFHLREEGVWCLLASSVYGFHSLRVPRSRGPTSSSRTGQTMVLAGGAFGALHGPGETRAHGSCWLL